MLTRTGCKIIRQPLKQTEIRPPISGLATHRNAEHVERAYPALPRMIVLAALLWIGGISLACAAFVVQVGAYSAPANVAAALARLRATGFPAITEPLPGRPLTAVAAGPYATRELANRARSRLKSKGWHGFVRPARAARKEAAASANLVNRHPVPMPHRPPTSAPSKRSPRPRAGSGGGIAGLFAPAPTSTPHTSQSGPGKAGIAGLFTQPKAKQTAPHHKGIGGLFAPETAAPAASLFAPQRIRPHGFFLSRLAYTYPAAGHWSMFQNLLDTGIQHQGNRISWKISGWLGYDPVYARSDFYPHAVREDQRYTAMLRQTYLDLSLGNWDVRLGRQQIVWGDMVGLFFADVVSALDVRQFVAQDFDLIRIPQWAVRTEYFKGNFHGEAVWIPYMTYDNIGKPGADFYPYPPPPPTGYNMVIEGEHRPHGLADGAYGVRMGYLLNTWDLTAFYYNSMNRAPTFFRTVVNGPTPMVIYRPDHTRIQQFGGTASRAYNDSVLKVEAVYTRNQDYNVLTLDNAQGVVKQNTLDYAVGLDYSLPRNSRVDVQFYQRWFINHNPNIIPDRFESGVSLLASTTFLNQQLKPEILLIHSLNRNEWMVQPQVKWTFATNWRAAVGADIFGGPPISFFGQYDNASRVYAQVRYAY